MDLPVSDYEDEVDSSSSEEVSVRGLQIPDPPIELAQKESQEDGANDSIREQEVKTKVTLAASMVLAKVPPKTTDLVAEISKPIAEKVTIRFQPIGPVPHITPKVFKISASQPFSTLIKFLEKRIRRTGINETKVNPLTGGPIFCYIHNSIAPSPDEIIANLFANFSVNNELIVAYCNTVAFG